MLGLRRGMLGLRTGMLGLRRLKHSCTSSSRGNRSKLQALTQFRAPRPRNRCPLFLASRRRRYPWLLKLLALLFPERSIPGRVRELPLLQAQLALLVLLARLVRLRLARLARQRLRTPPPPTSCS